LATFEAMETYNSYHEVITNQMDSFDFWTIIVVLLSACFLRTRKASWCLVTPVVLIIVGFVSPLISSGREVDRNITANGPAMDNFELWYVYLVFPIYWAVMIFALLLIYLKRYPAWNSLENS
jgi:TRAP-type C4-dicarboxylate transport system permease small subunit